jgi:Tol biopolymer transport system component
LVHFREAPPAVQVLRLSVAIPPNSLVGWFALSPDGRNLVIGIRGSGGKTQLWLRALDSPQLQPLSGTESARSPFWSADSRSIGFFADGKLKTILASGGPAQVLCDAGMGSGGTWNRDGVILFAIENGPLHRVEATGGACTPVTKVDGGSRHGHPTFLPDGNHFLYVSLGGEEAKRGVYVRALDNPSGRRVLTDRSSAIFVPPTSGIGHGHLLFLREATLMAQPFDAGTLYLAGDAFPVAGQVSTTSSPPQVAASASRNGVLVYLANSISDYQLTWFDRSGKEQAKVGPHGDLRGVSLSPNEKTVAFMDASRGIWLHDLIRSLETRFTFPPLAAYGSVWSPDGGRIAFGSSSSGGLYSKDASGGGQEELLLPQGNPKSPSDWSRDGRYLLYTEIDPKSRADIWILPDPLGKPGGTPGPFLQTEFIETEGQFSPDGRRIAYVSDETGQLEVYVRPFPAGVGKWKVSSNGGREPRWRKDGKELFYLEPEGLGFRLMAVLIQPGSGPVFEAGAPKPLFAFRNVGVVPQYNIFAYSASGDGQRFLVNPQVNVAEPTLNVIVNWEKAVKP